MIAVPFYLKGFGPAGEIWPCWETEPAQAADHKSRRIPGFSADPRGSVGARVGTSWLDNSIIHKRRPLKQERSSWAVEAGGRSRSLSCELYLPPPSALFPVRP